MMGNTETKYKTAAEAFDAEKKDTQIRYPDDLIAVWQFVHQEPECPLIENEVGQKWNGLRQILQDISLPTGNTKDRRLNAASDFLVSLFNAENKPRITTKAALIGAYRKYCARKNNPVQYELNQILAGALHVLVKAGKVRTDAPWNLYTADTRFVLAELKDPQMAYMTDYQEHKSMVSRYTTQSRGGDWEKTGLLTPTDAQNLCMQLLEAFGGWVTKRNLLSAMQNHIPEQLKVGSMPKPTTESGTQFEPKDPQSGGMTEFQEEQARSMGYEFAELIWTKICETYTDAFCLYFLPKKYYGQKVRLEDAGPTSTVNDHCGKIGEIFRECLGEYTVGRDEGRTSSVRMTMSAICENLSDRCSEKGYSPDLYACGDNN